MTKPIDMGRRFFPVDHKEGNVYMVQVFLTSTARFLVMLGAYKSNNGQLVLDVKAYVYDFEAKTLRTPTGDSVITGRDHPNFDQVIAWLDECIRDSLTLE
jgi:hypothetical protein